MKKLIMVLILFVLLLSLVVIAANITLIQISNIEKILNDDSLIISAGDKKYKYIIEKNMSNPAIRGDDIYICLGCDNTLK